MVADVPVGGGDRDAVELHGGNVPLEVFGGRTTEFITLSMICNVEPKKM